MNNLDEKTLKYVELKKPVLWRNHRKDKAKNVLEELELKYEDMIDAEERLQRFALLIKKLFAETKDGIIESQIINAVNLRKSLEEYYDTKINGDLYLKCDNYLEVAGSIKARGGIYEVLKHAEELAMENGLLTIDEDYSKLAEDKYRQFFSNYKIAVGSTGNLGMSIGIISAALGFKVFVHMSRDAKQWKKDLLRKKGVTVVEYYDDYSKAVEEGRKQAEGDTTMHFVDDENSKDLFLGYSVAALRLRKQFEQNGVIIDENNKLYVYLPCGVGGAPGGITFGLKQIYGNNVHCYYVEPIQSPCMLLGLLTQKFDAVSVKDYGLNNITEADGLAVGTPSKLVCSVANKLIDGIYTIEDEELFKLLAFTKDTEGVKIEPSAASSILGAFINEESEDKSKKATHLAWLTGGLFVPEEIYEEIYKRGKNMLK